MTFFSEVAGKGLMVNIRLNPRSRRNQMEGFGQDAAGEDFVKVSVTAPPEDGKANAALIELMAKVLGVPKSSCSVKIGATSRNKKLLIEGDVATLKAKLEKVGK